MLTEAGFDRLIERVEILEKTLQREGVALFEAPKPPAPTHPKAVAQHLRFETGLGGHMAFFFYECTCGQEHSASALVGREAKYTQTFLIKPIDGCNIKTSVTLNWA
jgi:hypothetical protein